MGGSRAEVQVKIVKRRRSISVSGNETQEGLNGLVLPLHDWKTVSWAQVHDYEFDCQYPLLFVIE